jgi:UDP-glucose 4-epimerase
VVNAVAEIVGSPVPHDIAPRRPGDPARLVGDSSRIKSDWGWQTKYGDLRTIVQHAWNWHRTHPDGYGEAA